MTLLVNFQINPENYENEKAFKQVREEKGYRCFDFIECCDKLPNYDQLLNRFYQEHIHSDEEIRFFLEGSGYFDVRDVDDNWIRIWAEKGDLILLPPGIYHRFTLDQKVLYSSMNSLDSKLSAVAQALLIIILQIKFVIKTTCLPIQTFAYLICLLIESFYLIIKSDLNFRLRSKVHLI